MAICTRFTSQQGVLSAADQQTIEQNLAAARAANAHVEILHGEDPIECILQFAYRHGITQIFVGHSQQDGRGWLSRWKVNPVERLIMESEGIDVRIFPTEAANEAVRSEGPPHHFSGLRGGSRQDL